MRLLSSSLIQVDDELIEASLISGAGMTRSVRTILAPILKPALLYAIAVIFVLSYRELGAVIFLVANNTSIVPYVSFTFWVSGGYPMLSALNVFTLIVPLIVICIAFLAARVRVRPAVQAPSADQLALPSISLPEVKEHVGS
jgi:iron(III) transport system permease protein